MSADGTVPKNPSPAPPWQAEPTSLSSPLNEEQFTLVRETARAFKPIKRASRVARGSSLTTLCIGVLSVPLVVLWPSIVGVVVVLGLGAVGIVEFLGYRKLLRAEPAAAKLLALNQLAFLGLITVYCLIQMLTFSAEDAKAAAMSPEFRSALKEMPEMARSVDSTIEQWGPLITYGFYSLVIVLSVFFQGGMAWYYISRRKYLEFYQRQPEWVRRLLIEGSTDAP
jgi:hypothetical protein